MSDQDDSGARATLRRAVRALAEESPLSYENLSRNLAAASRVVREEFAIILQPAINTQAASMPHRSYEEKKALANWINRELRQLGLAIRGPDGQPCLLQAGPARDHEVGRFRLDYMDDEGHRRSPSSSVALPNLEIMPDPQTSTPFRIRKPRSL